jgi:hypothetical protein
LDRAFSHSGEWFKTALPLLLLGALALPSAWRRAEGRLVVYYAAVSAALAISVLGGTGAGMTAIFDLEIALCLIIGLAIGRLDEDGRSAPAEGGFVVGPRPGNAAWWILLLALGLSVLSPLRLLEARELWRGSERAREAGEVIALLAKQPGPVACEDLSLSYWAGKGFEIDFFLVGQKLEQGLIDPRVVTERLRTG